MDNSSAYISISDVHITMSIGMSYKTLKSTYAVHIEITLPNNSSLLRLPSDYVLSDKDHRMIYVVELSMLDLDPPAVLSTEERKKESQSAETQ